MNFAQRKAARKAAFALTPQGQKVARWPSATPRYQAERAILAGVDALGLPHEPDATPTAQCDDDLRAARIATALLLPREDAGDIIDELYGEDVKAMNRHQKRALHNQIVNESRVRAILRDDLKDLAKVRERAIERMAEIILEGDADQAIRAFSPLARALGWNAATKVEVSGKSFNIHTMLNDPKAVHEALSLMSHEPGAAVAIQSDARDEYEKRHGALEHDADDL